VSPLCALLISYSFVRKTKNITTYILKTAELQKSILICLKKQTTYSVRLYQLHHSDHFRNLRIYSFVFFSSANLLGRNLYSSLVIVFKKISFTTYYYVIAIFVIPKLFCSFIDTCHIRKEVKFKLFFKATNTF